MNTYGASGGTIEAIRYKPEGCDFDSLWCRNFHWFNLSGRTVALESTQPPTEMSARYTSLAAGA